MSKTNYLRYQVQKKAVIITMRMDRETKTEEKARKNQAIFRKQNSYQLLTKYGRTGQAKERVLPRYLSANGRMNEMLVGMELHQFRNMFFELCSYLGL